MGVGIKLESPRNTKFTVALTLCLLRRVESKSSPPFPAPPPRAALVLGPGLKLPALSLPFWSYYECVCSAVLVSACHSEVRAQEKRLCQIFLSSC